MRATKSPATKRVIKAKGARPKTIHERKIRLTPKVNGIVIGCLEGQPAVQIAVASWLDGVGVEIPEGYDVAITGQLVVEISKQKEE